MSETPSAARRVLRYTITCAGCRGDIDIAPAELDQRLAVCPRCRMANPTPIYALLSGRRPGRATTAEKNS